MHSRLRPQKAIRVLSANLEHGALDPRLFALALVEHHDFKPATLGPPHVHAHEHLRPVLRFRSTGARAYLELRIAEVIGSAEERLDLERIEILAELRRFLVELALHRGLGAFLNQLVELQRAR